jgi:ATP-dependent RNA helicase SUPV3L1/SUV3
VALRATSFFYDLHESFPVTQHTDHPHSHEQLDAMTGGAFSAPTSGERSLRIREWLGTDPKAPLILEVYKEMSARDKGVSKQLREKLDELKRLQSQEQLIEDWALKGQTILSAPKFQIADALAWQRDAAKAGAPLSKEPLAGLKLELFERIKRVEDLEHRVQVQRESAVMMAQRIEVLSTKPWREAFDVKESLSKDVQAWVMLKEDLFSDVHWPSVDLKYAPALSSSGEQMQALWSAFSDALAQAEKASQSKDEALPQVPAWAEEIKSQRGGGEAAAPAQVKPKVDPELKAKATQAVRDVLKVLESEMAEGHGKASVSAAQNLRSVLKENSRWIDEKLEHQAQAALAAASELEGWQKWRADQLRLELVIKAEALFKKVAVKSEKSQNVTKVTRTEHKKKILEPLQEPQASEVPPTPEVPKVTENNLALAAENESSASALEQPTLPPQAAQAEAVEASEISQSETHHTSPDESSVVVKDQEIVVQKPQEMTWVPVMGGRKMQETLRELREQWKTVDQGGLPNHALWKRFDQACNRAHKVVEAWVEKVKLESAENKAQRLSLIEELKAWSVSHAHGPDWKAVVRQLHQFSDRWRDSGHVSEKLFGELQALWKEAMKSAHAPLEEVQNKSIQARLALIEEAKQLGGEPVLRIDAVKNLQQRWQQESQSVVLDRRQEQKLWDAFRQPIDEAFERKTKQREQSMAAVNAFDSAVIAASKALEDAVAKQDAQAIRECMQALDKLMRGEVVQPEPSKAQADAKSTPAQEASTPHQTSGEEQGLKVESDAQSAAQGEGVAALPQSSDPSQVAAKEAAQDPTPLGDAPLDPSHSEPVSEPVSEAVSEPQAVPVPVPKSAPKPVIAVRGDDRPGQKRQAPAAPGQKNFKDARGGKSRDGQRDPGPDRHKRSDFDPRAKAGFDAPRGPRLGDQAYRAQRQAFEQAQYALKKLSALAHGESLTQFLSAWETRDAERVPALKELGPRVKPADRVAMVQALKAKTQSQPHAQQIKTALLRLEMAAEQPTPAEHLSDRRALQLQLLTKRNDPTPIQTWSQDVAVVLSAPYESQSAQRLQAVLKVLMKKGA